MPSLFAPHNTNLCASAWVSVLVSENWATEQLSHSFCQFFSCLSLSKLTKIFAPNFDVFPGINLYLAQFSDSSTEETHHKSSADLVVVAMEMCFSSLVSSVLLTPNYTATINRYNAVHWKPLLSARRFPILLCGLELGDYLLCFSCLFSSSPFCCFFFLCFVVN